MRAALMARHRALVWRSQRPASGNSDQNASVAWWPAWHNDVSSREALGRALLRSVVRLSPIIRLQSMRGHGHSKRLTACLTGFAPPSCRSLSLSH